MRGRLRITPLEKRLLLLTLVGLFLLLGVIINDFSEPENAEKSVDPRKTLEFPIDLNKASEKDLEKLPMIGQIKAKAIVRYRNENGPFKRIEDVVNVSGIGEKTFERIKPYITISDPGTTLESAKNGMKVNVNTATVEELKKLPGIGIVKAKRIIENRPYRSPKDLLRVPGIGKKTLDKISDMIDF